VTDTRTTQDPATNGSAAAAEPVAAAGPFRLEVAHEVPGRLRARCAELRERPELNAALEALARELPGFESVAVRPLTASVVIRYSLEDATPRAFRAALARRAQLAETPPAPPAAAPAEPLGGQLIEATRRWWAEADTAVRHSSGGWLDLKSCVPWLLIFLAMRQIARGGNLPALPWYTALYYALQTIMRYPPGPAEGSASDDMGE
jgi:hypothetical protein